MSDSPGSEADAEAVLEAAAQWTWIPDDAEVARTDDYLLVAYPAYFSDPTQVQRTHSDRPAAELIAEVRDHVRGWARPSVMWWTGGTTRPADLEDALVAAGAVRHETLAVQARALHDEGGVEAYDVRPVLDEQTMRDREAVAVAVFGGEVPPPDRITAETRRALDAHAAGQQLSVVAYRDGEPVGTGGVTIADGFARLWSGATLESARGRGVYRSLLAARMAWAHEQGAHTALVKARVDTSAPILSRLGFTTYGEERGYVLEA